MFKRKVYDELLDWKEKYFPKYACLLEGARRVGKTTIVKEFVENEFDSSVIIDFSSITDNLLSVFDDISNIDLFLLRLQAETGIDLIEGRSAIVFDEVQLYPKARQAIKHLVKDGRYAYIETGSLISIKRNVKDILIPSEEHRIEVYPMDFEEFTWAIGGSTKILKEVSESQIALGDAANRKIMRDFRIYMAVGGMPQAVEAYIQSNNFNEVDRVKREIIALYEDDLRKLDPSGKLSSIYKSIPAQLALDKKKFSITMATGRQKTARDEERIWELIDSKMVIPCYHISHPEITLTQTVSLNSYKLYIADIGLFTTLLFNDSKNSVEDIYKKLLGDKLSADLGYLYENVFAQLINAKGRGLFFHTWKKDNSTHYYEVDFILREHSKIMPIEVKSSSIRNHKSIDAFGERYSKIVGERYLFSQKDVGNIGALQLRPIYMIQFMFD